MRHWDITSTATITKQKLQQHKDRNETKVVTVKHDNSTDQCKVTVSKQNGMK